MEMIGRYRITGRIGSGSFATVYRGEDEYLDVPVAIKVLAENWAGNEDVRSRFLAEARLLRRLNDERVVAVHDIGTTPAGQPYFVMDMADGGSFEQFRKRLLPPGLALRMCAEGCRALDVLHRNQLVHRDVTPGNLLLSNTPAGVRVMLADLGVAKSLLDEQRDTMTAGTPAYMAPEQARSTLLDQRSDIYSMGAVTYAMLSGHRPFPGTTLADVLNRHPNVGPPPLAARLSAPPLLDEVLGSALAHDPNRRPQTALALADVLDRLADMLPGGDQFHAAPAQPGRPSAPAAAPMAPVPVAPGQAPVMPTALPAAQTPTVMLDNYLGATRYRPAQTAERHPVWLYLLMVVAAMAVLGLTAWATTYFLTR